MIFLKLGLIALICMSVSQCVPLFPKGHKWVYEYCAKAHVGTMEPVKSTTGMIYHGKLIVESFSNKVVLMKLEEMETTYYNGDKEHVKGKGEPLAEGAKVIEKPFLVHYSGSTIDNIFVAPDEPLWSFNMKKAIAGVFQLQMDKMSEGAKHIEETNIYGHCQDVEYMVKKVSEDEKQITKMLKMDKCQKSPFKIYTSTSTPLSKPMEPLMSATRSYILNTKGANPTLQNVTALFQKFVYGFNSEDSAYKSMSRQKFGLISVSELPADHVVPDSLTLKKDLIFEQPVHFELLHDRKPIPQEQIIQGIQDMATKMIHRLDDKFVMDPNVLHDNLLVYMHWMISSLSMESLEKLYTAIAEEEDCLAVRRKNLILELLPQIGTHDSILFMKKLIVEGKVGAYMGLKMLAQYPFYVHHYTEELLVEMEELLHIKSEKFGKAYWDTFLDTAALSFSNLLYKTYSAHKCSTEVYETYVSKYYKYLTESKPYGKKMVYIQALGNMQYGSVVDLLIPIVQSKENSRHLRFQTTKGLMTIGHEHPAKMYELFWPIFTDRTEHLEMRSVALRMLLTSEPTSSRFFSVYWYMKSEPCKQLYKLYCALLVTMSTCPTLQDTPMAKLSENFLVYVKTPTKTTFQKYTELIMAKYVNSATGFGTITQTLMMTEDYEDWPYLVSVDFVRTGYGRMFERFGVYVKRSGHKSSETHSNESKDKREDILKMIERTNVKVRKPEPFHVEMALLVHDKVVFCKHWDDDSSIKLPMVLAYLENFSKTNKCGGKWNGQYTTMPPMGHVFGTTDFGTQIYMGVTNVGIGAMKMDFSVTTPSAESKKAHAYGATNYTTMEFQEQSLDLYNPLSDIYQGIVKMKAMDVGFGLNLTITKEEPSHTYFMKWVDSNMNNGFVTHQQTITYNIKMDQILDKHRITALSMKPIHSGDKFNEEHILPIRDLGLKLKMSVFNCDDQFVFVRRWFDDFVNMVDFIENLNSFDEKWKIFYQLMAEVQERFNFHSTEDSCGVAVQVLPFHDEPMTMDIVWKYYRDYEAVYGKNKIPISHVDTYLMGNVYPTHHPDKKCVTWNISVDSYEDFGLIKELNFFVARQERPEDKPWAFYLDYVNPYEAVGTWKTPKADFYNLEPIKSSSPKINIGWGKTKAFGNMPEDQNINFIYRGSISDEQKEAVKKSDKWPFKQCKEHLHGHDFTPASEACYRSALEMSTYRKYDSYITVKNANPTMETFITQFFSTISPINPTFEKGYTNIHFTEVVPMDKGKRVKFTYENVTDNLWFSDVYFTLFPLSHPKIERMQYEHAQDYGVCVITPEEIKTYHNHTIEHFDKSKEYMVIGKCNSKPSYVVFMKLEEKHVFHYHVMVYDSIYEITYNSKEDTLIVEKDKTKIDITKENEHLYVQHHDGWLISFDKVDVSLTMRPGFTVVVTKEEDTCGICNMHHYEYLDFVSTKA